MYLHKTRKFFLLCVNTQIHIKFEEIESGVDSEYLFDDLCYVKIRLF